MADPRDVIHQIEFRWQHEKGLSPFASTMPPSVTDGWNDLVRAWVRHPEAAGLLESWCYQIWDRDAALAWRYRDPLAAEADGTSGRPHVSRVLVGHASLLTPEVAIALCLLGLPPSARPGRVSAPDELPTIDADELTTEVNKKAAEFDRVAAKAKGLPELTAAALSDRDRPLAVYVPEHLITGRPRQSPQGRLLWGLRRILSEVPGAGRRGWSFSSFELPLGAQDATTLPDIVFRQATRESGPPGIVRDEVKAWPFDTDALAGLDPRDVTRACRFVEAYAAHGIDGVERLVADDARADLMHRTLQGTAEDHSSDGSALTESAPPGAVGPQPAAPRPPGPPYPVGQRGPGPQLGAYPRAQALSATTRVLPAGPQRQPESPDPVEQRESRPGPEPEAPINPPAPPQPAVTVLTSVPPATVRKPEEGAVDAPPSRPEPGQPAAQPEQPEQQVGKHHKFDDLASSREGQPSPPLSLADPPRWQRPTTEYGPPTRDQRRPPGRIDDLLKQMRDAPDVSAVRELLRLIVESGADLGRDERQQARRMMSRDDWYGSVASSSSYWLEPPELARIFQLVVIPDLGKAGDVTERIEGWADDADPAMICGLLLAARDAVVKETKGLMPRKGRKDLVEQVRQIMLPRLAERWTREQGIAEWWEIDRQP